MTALDFELPPELEAHEPAELRGSGRDDVRMIVSYKDGRTPSSTHFRELPDFLRAGDLLVLNTSATLPAALTALRANGEEIALHWSTSLAGGLDVVEPRYEVAGRRKQVAGRRPGFCDRPPPRFSRFPAERRRRCSRPIATRIVSGSRASTSISRSPITSADGDGRFDIRTCRGSFR
jgi:hypothetical protein